jgi:hypothetical protein
MDENDKTIEQELEEQKRTVWNSFKELDYDSLLPEQREQRAQELAETLSLRPTPPALDVPYDFWKAYEDTDEIKDVNRFVKRVDDTLTQVKKMQTPPTKDSWLDKDRGIIPNMKREWKTKLDPFTNERTVKKMLEKKLNEIANLPENKGKPFSVNLPDIMQKALDNIEETAYKPVRAKIDEIETEVYNRLGLPQPKRFVPPTKKVKDDGTDNAV